MDRKAKLISLCILISLIALPFSAVIQSNNLYSAKGSPFKLKEKILIESEKNAIRKEREKLEKDKERFLKERRDFEKELRKVQEIPKFKIKQKTPSKN